MSDDSLFDPFTTKFILNIPELAQSQPDAWPGFQIDLNLTSGLLALAPSDYVKLQPLQTDVLNLDLSDFPPLDVSLPEPDSTTPSDEEEDSKEQHEKGYEVDEEDVWALRDILHPPKENRLISWDSFMNPSQKIPTITYTSEAGPAGLDALLRNLAKDDAPGKQLKHAKPDLFITALFDLALGRTSVFFHWNTSKHCFASCDDKFTLSGLSEQAVNQIISTFLGSGSQWRNLEDFKHSSGNHNAMRVAFIGAVENVLNMVRDIVEKRRAATVTIIQVQELFHKTFDLVDLMHQILKIMQRHSEDAKHQTSAYQLLSDLFMFASRASFINPMMERLLFLVLKQVTQPAIQLLNTRIGLCEMQGPLDGQLGNALKHILSRPVCSQIDLTESLLQLLQQVAPQKIVALRAATAGRIISLANSWTQVGKFQQGARTYEEACLRSLRKRECLEKKPDFEKNVKLHEIPAGSDHQAFVFDLDLFGHTTTFERRVMAVDEHSTNFREAIRSALFDTQAAEKSDLIPLAQLVELSATPLLTAQHRITSYVVLQTLFVDFHLLQHMQSLQRLHLMADGLFASRLSTALFDTNQASSDIRQKMKSTTGLRLQSRDVWPPTSSELRLVLMDILSQSMSDLKDNDVVHSTSFAIRDLTDDDLERCRDVNSIYALDFLRLHYRAPESILETVITAKALKRYDRIFMYLLRLLRIKDLTQYLFRQTFARQIHSNQMRDRSRISRNSNRALWEMHHFASALANYSQNIAITTYWREFEAELYNVKTRLDANDYEGTLKLTNGPDHLRQRHEAMLSSISTALFLRKSQYEIRRRIEEIFGLVLRCAASMHINTTSGEFERDDDDNNDEITNTTARFYGEFRKKLDLLIDCLNATVQNANMNGQPHFNQNDESIEREDQIDATMAEQLVLALDFAGYYAKQK